MYHELETFYKGHKVNIKFARDIKRRWVFTAWIDNGFTMNSVETFNMLTEAEDAALLMCAEKIESPQAVQPL